jgi:hypothetical protein
MMGMAGALERRSEASELPTEAFVGYFAGKDRKIILPGVRTEHIAGEVFKVFELEIDDPERFIDQVSSSMSEIFPGASNFTLSPQGIVSYSDRGIERNSYVGVSPDQTAKLFVDTHYISMAPSRFTISDSGFPYQWGGTSHRFDNLPERETNWDGRVSVDFFEETDVVKVMITGRNPGALVSAATGYLRGIKQGQESILQGATLEDLNAEVIKHLEGTPFLNQVLVFDGRIEIGVEPRTGFHDEIEAKIHERFPGFKVTTRATLVR